MVKGFSDSEVKNDAEIKNQKRKKGLAAFLKGKNLLTLYLVKTNKYFWINSTRLKFDFDFASHPLFKNQEFHDFVFNVGR